MNSIRIILIPLLLLIGYGVIQTVLAATGSPWLAAGGAVAIVIGLTILAARLAAILFAMYEKGLLP